MFKPDNLNELGKRKNRRKISKSIVNGEQFNVQKILVYIIM